MGELLEWLHSPQLLLSIFTAVAVTATVVSVGLPLLERNDLSKRMRAVALERDKIRARERARLDRDRDKVALRQQQAKPYMQRVVEKLKLRQGLMTEDMRDKLRMAGFRSDAHVIAYLFARVVLPIALFLASLIYVFVIGNLKQPPLIKIGMVLGAAYLGFFLPNLWVTNLVQKRQTSIRRAFPDALDLLLICVESGMSIEAAFRKVAQEIGQQSIPLAEELSLTVAELSFLQDRRQAYENLAKRIGLPGVKAVVVALVQSERYGTPLSQTLRVMAQENRDLRMNEAEKRAAALPPKLTVPMIVFFLPVLFVVILGPAAIKLMALD
jgi:tight adherence protein C